MNQQNYYSQLNFYQVKYQSSSIPHLHFFNIFRPFYFINEFNSRVHHLQGNCHHLSHWISMELTYLGKLIWLFLRHHLWVGYQNSSSEMTFHLSLKIILNAFRSEICSHPKMYSEVDLFVFYIINQLFFQIRKFKGDSNLLEIYWKNWMTKFVFY